MIVDFHTHIFPDAIAERAIATLSARCALEPSFDGTAAGLATSMTEAGIGLSVFHPVITKPTQTRTANAWAAEVSGGGLCGFGGLHPLNDDFEDRLNEICSLGLKGVKLHPDYQDFFVDDPAMFPLYHGILCRGLMLMLHCGVDIGFAPPYHCTPPRLARVLDAMQGGVIIAAHLGGHGMWNEVEEHLAGHDVYLDTCMGLPYYGKEQLLRMVSLHGHEKILFASDAPWSSQKEELERMKRCGLHQDALDGILGGNARRLLGLS